MKKLLNMSTSKIVYPTIEEYISRLCEQESPLLKRLNNYTQENIHGAHMISGHYQGRLLSLLSKIIAPRSVLEIGTYTGYSALCLVEGLSKDGRLISIETDEKLRPLHETFLKDHPQIKIIYGAALDVIPTLSQKFDLVFIDADKRNYSLYLDLMIDKVAQGGIIICDNTLWKGKVVEKVNGEDKSAKITKAILEFNEKIHKDNRVEQLILPIRDGLSIVRKIS